VATLTVLYPPAGPLGAGLSVSGVTAGAGLSVGDTVDAYLRRPGIANTVARGLYTHVSGSSWRCTFINHFDIGCEQGVAVDLELVWRDSGGSIIDAPTISGTYINDSLSKLWEAIAAAGGGGHDPMLDDILASVRQVYP
jgi:hypothetical protein